MCHDLALVGFGGPLADEQALRLDAEHDGDDDEQGADHQRAERVEEGVVGDRCQADTQECEHESDQSADVLEQHDRKLGCLGVTDERDPGLVLRADLVALLDRGAQRERLQQDRDAQNRQRDPQVLEFVRIQDLLDALVDREQAADGEQDDGHQERVDVALSAVAEGVRRVRPLLRLPAPEEQKQLVAAVCHRVDGLGEHGRRPGERPGDELRQRDPHVRKERRDDRLAAA
jgi:hypothetical protein